MKTIKHWLSTLPSPYREQAIHSTEPDLLKQSTSSLFIALQSAFVWSRTPEGNRYWSELVKEIQNKPKTK